MVPDAPRPLGRRAGVLGALVVLAVWAFVHLGLSPGQLVPSAGGWQVAVDFLSRAWSPALVSEADYVPPGTPPLLWLAAESALATVAFAAAAIGIALILGLALGFAASTSWWEGDPSGGRTAVGRILRSFVLPASYVGVRTVIAGMRSVHEVLWAVLFLVAFGLTPAAALCALVIPYAGTFAKIFSEMIDETPRDAARALRGAGASASRVFAIGLVARSLPEMTAYTFYRFECALRSAAVLGFFGFETLGLHLRQSFRSLSYGEVWTYLYVLFATIALFDWWSGAIRRRLRRGGTGRVVVGGRVAELRNARPRSRFVRFSLVAAGLGILVSWATGGFSVPELFSERRLANLERFVGEVRPYPLRGVEWDWGVFAGWVSELMNDRGWSALLSTLAISILAVVLAALVGYALALPAARNLASPEPFAPSSREPSRWQRMFWGLVVAAARVLLIFLRALPEYVWAFLLLAVLGPTAWPAVLALAIHNAGILGRLGAETVEDLESRTPAALRALGATRARVVAVALFPAALSRLLLFFFYRWETCVREATVLGMLGVVSLGYWIDDARVRMQHDTFVFLIALGALIVLVGDLLSAWARRVVREA